MKLIFQDLEDIIREISVKDLEVKVFKFPEHEKLWYLQVWKWRVDVDTGDWGWGKGGKYYISPWSTHEEVRQKALAACIAFVEHEVRETFLWKGRAIFGPHLDHNKLWECANSKVERE